MTRTCSLLLGLTLTLAPPAAAQWSIVFSDHSPGEHLATEYLPDLAAYPGQAVNGALAPIFEREVVFHGPVNVSLVGVTSANELTLRHSSGASMTAKVRCFWSDAAGGIRTWFEFNCFSAGRDAPKPLLNADRAVYLRAYVEVDAVQTSGARAGAFSAPAYFRVDAQ